MNPHVWNIVLPSIYTPQLFFMLSPMYLRVQIPWKQLLIVFSWIVHKRKVQNEMIWYMPYQHDSWIVLFMSNISWSWREHQREGSRNSEWSMGKWKSTMLCWKWYRYVFFFLLLSYWFPSPYTSIFSPIDPKAFAVTLLIVYHNLQQVIHYYRIN